MTQARSILILSTDAGSGHRSAAHALQAAFRRRYGRAARVEMCNPWQHPHAPMLLRRYERAYMDNVQHRPVLYQLGYALSELPIVRHAIDRSMRRLQQSTIRHILAVHPADLVISVYPRLTAAIAAQRPAQSKRPRLMTVVTDLGDVHHSWFSANDDYCVVPTAVAQRKALYCGLESGRVITIGIPVRDEFFAPCVDVIALRHSLGWRPDLPALLLLGGGAGVGQLAALAEALDSARLPLQLAVVTGANAALAARLSRHPWHIPVQIYGHVPLATLMHAADMIATKSGGLTVSEALAAAKPLLIHSAAPGQEAGNLQYLQATGGGQWTPTPGSLVAQVMRWLTHPEELAHARSVARGLSCPKAADAIAQVGWSLSDS